MRGRDCGVFLKREDWVDHWAVFGWCFEQKVLDLGGFWGWGMPQDAEMRGFWYGISMVVCVVVSANPW
jgi:hypothetical protein